MATASGRVIAPQAVPTMYRRFIKLYIRKFGRNFDLIVAAWKQTRYEFMYYRDAPAEDVPVLFERGEEIYKSIQAGLLPIMQDPTTGKMHVKIDEETMKASGEVIEPMSSEEYLRRHHKKFEDEELKSLQKMLVDCGRWQGPLEFNPLHGLKKKKKVRCTDPDEPPAAATPEAAVGSSSAAPSSSSSPAA